MRRSSLGRSVSSSPWPKSAMAALRAAARSLSGESSPQWPSMISMWRDSSRMAFLADSISKCCFRNNARLCTPASRSCSFVDDSACTFSSHSMMPLPSSRFVICWCCCCSRIVVATSAHWRMRTGSSTLCNAASFSSKPKFSCRSEWTLILLSTSFLCSMPFTSLTVLSLLLRTATSASRSFFCSCRCSMSRMKRADDDTAGLSSSWCVNLLGELHMLSCPLLFELPCRLLTSLSWLMNLSLKDVSLLDWDNVLRFCLPSMELAFLRAKAFCLSFGGVGETMGGIWSKAASALLARRAVGEASDDSISSLSSLIPCRHPACDTRFARPSFMEGCTIMA
mmetsp:Transcript_73317/g.203398  ORF Transcript_73317/g.203398 Transcript_73317/m.203398 type:complete len:338 (+) Transcript_73317:361-1374(+)